MHVNSSYYQDLSVIRSISPIIVNHTNVVSISLVANCLLAIGASPLMTQSTKEANDLMQLSQALVINSGTPNAEWERLAESLIQAARSSNKPVVLDPVGAGASAYRKQLNLRLMRYGVDVVRGNASEIRALTDSKLKAGIDASDAVESVVSAAKHVANLFNCVVVVSGEVDLITNGRQCIRNSYGTNMLTKITGAGCALTAMIGAFIAVNNDYLYATTHAITLYTQIAESACQACHGAASFQVQLLDRLCQA